MGWIFHDKSVCRRSDAKLSAEGYAAYMNRDAAEDEREARSYDWSGDQSDLLERRFVPGEGAPEWVRAFEASGDTVAFWKEYQAAEDRYIQTQFASRGMDAVEAAQNRATIDFRVIAALPVELDEEQLKAAAADFVQRAYTSRGVTVSYAIHSDEGNPHLHIQGATRRLDADGVGPRLQEYAGRMFRTEALQRERATFAQVGNEHLVMAGHAPRLDHRSYFEQGIDLEPTIHEGYSARVNAAEGIDGTRVDENWLRRVRNAQRLTDDPGLIIKEVFANSATATEADLKRALWNRVAHTDQFDTLAIRLMADPELVRVGVDVFGKDRFTTREYLAAEQRAVASAEALAARVGHKVDLSRIPETVDRFYSFLAPEERSEVYPILETLLQPRDLTVAEGWAGTGKTTVLQAANAILQAEHYEVRGFALSGAAAENLETETGIQSTTIDAYITRKRAYESIMTDLAEHTVHQADRARLEKQAGRLLDEIRITDKSVIVIDEFGMVGTRHADELLSDALSAGAKVIGAGDVAQYKPVSAGDPFRAVVAATEREGTSVRLEKIVRQKEAWQRAASVDLSRGEVRTALEAYADHDRIHFAETHDQAVHDLVDAYFQDRDLLKPGETQEVITFTRRDAAALNDLIRERAIERGEVTRSVAVGDQQYGVGDRVMFTENMKEQYVPKVRGERAPRPLPGEPVRQPALETIAGEARGVKNGTVGRITAIYEHDGQMQFVVAVEKSDRKIMFDAKAIDDKFALAYARTGHKLQGQTADRPRVLESIYTRDDAALVQLTRHKQDVHLHVSREQFADVKALADSYQRPSVKDLVMDYDESPARLAARERVQTYREVRKDAGALQAQISAEVGPHGDIRDHASFGRLVEVSEQKKALALEIEGAWKQHKFYAGQAGVSREKVLIDAGLRERPLSELEQGALERMRSYADVATRARDAWNAIHPTHPGVHSRNHPDFAEFDALREERDKIAADLVRDPAIHRRFARDVKVSWKSVVSQAAADGERSAEVARRAAMGQGERKAATHVASYRDLRGRTLAAHFQNDKALADRLALRAESFAGAISRDLERYEPELGHQGVKMAQFANDAARFEIRGGFEAAAAARTDARRQAALRRVVDAARVSPTAERFAAGLAKKNGMKWQDLQRDVAAEIRSEGARAIRATFDTVEQRLADHVMAYGDLSDRAYRARAAGDFDEAERVGRKAEAMAAQITRGGERYRAPLRALRVPASQLELEAARHEIRTEIRKAAGEMRAGAYDAVPGRAAKALRAVGGSDRLDRFAGAVAREAGIRWAPLARQGAEQLRSVGEQAYMAVLPAEQRAAMNDLVAYRDLRQQAAVARVAGNRPLARELSEKGEAIAARLIQDPARYEAGAEVLGISRARMTADAARFEIRAALRWADTAARSADVPRQAEAATRIVHAIAGDPTLERYAAAIAPRYGQRLSALRPMASREELLGRLESEIQALPTAATRAELERVLADLRRGNEAEARRSIELALEQFKAKTEKLRSEIRAPDTKGIAVEQQAADLAVERLAQEESVGAVRIATSLLSLL